MDFRWNAWNIEHLGQHGVTPEAAEEAVQAARSPYPRKVGEDKLLVWGASEQGELPKWSSYSTRTEASSFYTPDP